MASIWKLNGGDIYVSDYRSQITPSIAELNPINSTSSTYHYIHTPDDEINVEGIVIGSGHLTTIEAGLGSTVTLITDLVPGGVTVLFQDLSYNRLPSTCQLVDGTLPTTAPVYSVTAVVRL
jgi:hypothetical protein